jgi:hypothetical protein
LPKSRRHVGDEHALRIGVLSAAPPVRSPASTQAYGCKALDNAVRLISKLIAHTVRRLTEFTILRKRSAISENDGGELFHPEEERSCLMFN